MNDRPWREHVPNVDRNQNRNKTLIARSLAVGGLVLIGTGLNSLIFALIPLQLTSPDWLLRLINALLATSMQLLVGTLVLLVARVFNSRDLKLAKRVDWIETAALWWGILLLLTIPLQIYAGTTSLEQQEARENKNIMQMRQAIEMIKTATDDSQLRRIAASLTIAPIIPADFEAPLPVVKDRILTNINTRLNEAIKQRSLSNPQPWQTFLADAIRNGIQAGLLATACFKITKYHDKAKNRSRT
jgi:hypothetical protein